VAYSENSIVSFVLYGFETWSPTLREEDGLGVFVDRGTEGVKGGWKILQNEELHDWRSFGRLGHVARIVKMGNS
jgi:hypothetical protein